MSCGVRISFSAMFLAGSLLRLVPEARSIIERVHSHVNYQICRFSLTELEKRLHQQLQRAVRVTTRRRPTNRTVNISSRAEHVLLEMNG